MQNQDEDLDQDQNEMVQQQEQHDHPPVPEHLQNRTQEHAGSDFSGTGEAIPSPAKTNKREQLDNAGNLFKNDRKSKDTHPDISGSAMINGSEFYVSGWRKTGAKGDFYSLSFKPKDTSAAAKELI